MAIELKLNKVVFQSDALVVVDCINSIVCNVALEPILAECRSLLRCFAFGYVLFLPSLSNFDAHNMVSLGKLYGSRTCCCSGFFGPSTLMKVYFP